MTVTRAPADWVTPRTVRSKYPRSALKVQNSASRACRSACLSSAKMKGSGEAIGSGKEITPGSGRPPAIVHGQQARSGQDSGELVEPQRRCSAGLVRPPDHEPVAQVHASRD